MKRTLWQLVQVSDVLDLEFASALAESVDVLAWKPQRTWRPGSVATGRELEEADPDVLVSTREADGGHTPLRIRSLPLLHGFARRPITWLMPTARTVVERLLAQTSTPEVTPLICTTPYFAPVAERWPGPVVYWLTDLIARYNGVSHHQVIRLDRRMCAAATLVCPNSARLASYLRRAAGCHPAKLHVLPNATRAANVFEAPPAGPDRFPPLDRIGKPIAGVIGNLAANMDWLLLRELVERTPWLAWVFVGPTAMDIPQRPARRARQAVMRLPNVLFAGRQPYGALAQYARAFDVAVLPYRRCEPTYSGSSTRFYEHLAACRPMLATRGLEELSHKEPLLQLFDTAEQGIAALERLRQQNFDDGRLEQRWRASQDGTWQARAAALQQALAERLLHPHQRTSATALPQLAGRS